MSANASVNLENAQHSTGPRTEEGKNRVRFNALKHGLDSQTVVLPSEDHAAYEALNASYTRRFHPRTPDQQELVQSLVDARWRLNRLVAIESNLLTLGAAQHLERIAAEFGPLDDATLHALAQAAAFQANARVFDQLSRHQGRLQRLIDRTRQELAALATPPAVPAVPAMPPNGFVPSPPRIQVPEMPQFTGPMADIKRKQWLRRQMK